MFKRGDNRRIFTRAIWLAAVMLMVSGCAQVQELQQELRGEAPEEWSAQETTVEVKEDGKIVETVIEELDQVYYHTDELAEMIDQEIGAYNSSAGEGSITENSLSAEGGTVRLALTYASWKDYSAFNKISFYSGSVLGAQMEGYLFDEQFRTVDEEGLSSTELIGADEPLSHKELRCVISDDTHAVRVPGRIRYVSEAGMTTDGLTVYPVPEQEEEASQEDAAMPSDRMIYVLFE